MHWFARRFMLTPRAGRLKRYVGLKGVEVGNEALHGSHCDLNLFGSIAFAGAKRVSHDCRKRFAHTDHHGVCVSVCCVFELIGGTV